MSASIPSLHVAERVAVWMVAAADASFIGPFDFARLPLSLLVAFVAFDEVPDRTLWIGAAIIVCTALYLAHEESRSSLRAPLRQGSGGGTLPGGSPIAATLRPRQLPASGRAGRRIRPMTDRLPREPTRRYATPDSRARARVR